MQVLVIKTDGGPDRNNTFVNVQLACYSLTKQLEIEKLILMRTEPGQSHVNPVKRVMSVLNLALEGYATAWESAVQQSSRLSKERNARRRRALLCQRQTRMWQALYCHLLKNGQRPCKSLLMLLQPASGYECQLRDCIAHSRHAI
jgi:hypothetical protein